MSAPQPLRNYNPYHHFFILIRQCNFKQVNNFKIKYKSVEKITWNYCNWVYHKWKSTKNRNTCIYFFLL